MHQASTNARGPQIAVGCAIQSCVGGLVDEPEVQRHASAMTPGSSKSLAASAARRRSATVTTRPLLGVAASNWRRKNFVARQAYSTGSRIKLCHGGVAQA